MASSLRASRQGLEIVDQARRQKGWSRQASIWYANFNSYLGEKMGAHIELEPAFNEKKALERIQNQAWSLVFAPPGIAAIAIAYYQYLPLFPCKV